MKTIITNSPEETMKLAKDMGKELKPGAVITLSGELGAGKTLFTKGIARGMGIDEEITSPSFSLLEIHEGDLTLYHFDLYRIEFPDELEELYFEEYWEGEGVSIIEWPERAHEILPEKRTEICIEYMNSNSRRITIEHLDN